MSVENRVATFAQNTGTPQGKVDELAGIELPKFGRELDSAKPAPAQIQLVQDGKPAEGELLPEDERPGKPQPKPEVEEKKQVALKLFEKHRALLIGKLPPELVQAIFQRSPLRVSSQFLQDVDSLSAVLKKLPAEAAKGKESQQTALTKLAVIHLQGQGLVRTAVAEELLINPPDKMQGDLRRSLIAAMDKVGWKERQAAANAAIESYIGVLKREKGLPQEKELAKFLETVQTTIEGNDGLPVTNPAQLQLLKAELSRVTGRPADEFPFPINGLSMLSATMMVQDTLTTEYIIDNLALTNQLGSKGDELPSWSKIQKGLEETLSGLRNTQRDTIVSGIMNRLKGYSKLDERRDEIIRVAGRQVSDSIGWDRWVPYWGAHYYYNAKIKTSDHMADFEKVKTRDSHFKTVEAAAKKEAGAKQTLFTGRQLQTGVESEIQRRGAFLFDPSKIGDYNPSAADFRSEFAKERNGLIRKLKN